MNTHLTPLRFLERSASVHPNKTACVDGSRRITFAQFAHDAQAFARALLADGISPGARVGVLAANSYEALLAQFAIPLAAGVIVAINTRLAPKEVAYIVEHAEIDIMLGEKDLLDAALPALSAPLTRVIYIADETGVEPRSASKNSTTFSAYQREGKALAYTVDDENRPIAINYTSGTMGTPKGVIYTHRGAYLNALGKSPHKNSAPPRFISGPCRCSTALDGARGGQIWRSLPLK